MSPAAAVPALAASLLAVTLLTGCTAEDGEGDGSRSGGGPSGPGTSAAALPGCREQAGRPAAGGAALPDLAFPCPGGGEFDLGQAPGVPTVVNLWGSWCPPCREELPLFQDLADGAGSRLQVVGLVSKDGVPQAVAFADEVGVTFPTALDADGALMAEFGLVGLPFTMFIDADGRLVHSEIGPVDSVGELEGLVAEHLGVRL